VNYENGNLEYDRMVSEFATNFTNFTNSYDIYFAQSIKPILDNIRAERDLNLKPIPPKFCPNKNAAGYCDCNNMRCKDLYPVGCMFVVKFNHYQDFVKRILYSKDGD